MSRQASLAASGSTNLVKAKTSIRPSTNEVRLSACRREQLGAASEGPTHDSIALRGSLNTYLYGRNSETGEMYKELTPLVSYTEVRYTGSSPSDVDHSILNRTRSNQANFLTRKILPPISCVDMTVASFFTSMNWQLPLLMFSLILLCVPLFTPPLIALLGSIRDGSIFSIYGIFHVIANAIWGEALVFETLVPRCGALRVRVPQAADASNMQHGNLDPDF